jgi:hypothetical protein
VNDAPTIASRGRPPPPAPLSILSSQLASPALSGPALAGTVLPGTVLPGPALAGTVLPGTVLPGPALAGTVLPGGLPAPRDERAGWERCSSGAKEEPAIGVAQGAQAAARATVAGSGLTGRKARQAVAMTAAANTEYRRSTAQCQRCSTPCQVNSRPPPAIRIIV